LKIKKKKDLGVNLNELFQKKLSYLLIHLFHFLIFQSE